MLDTTRNATLSDMVKMLESQQVRKIDVVAPASTVRVRDGAIQIAGVEPVLTDDGVQSVDGTYIPTGAAADSIARKLDIPVTYLRRLRAERPDMWDGNVNGLLHGRTAVRGGERELVYPGDGRSFLLRLFRGDDGGPGVMRALLSDKYGMVDNLDVLTAVMEGVRQADVDVEIRGCDLTDTSMNVRVHSPTVAQAAPGLLAGYRNPFDNRELAEQRDAVSREVAKWRDIAQREGKGYERGSEPIVHAGFRFGNSETGNAAFTLKPEIVVQICRNGLTIPALEIRNVHLGAKLEAGAVRWSHDTQARNLALITAKARDAVATWLSRDFLGEQVQKIEATAGRPVTAPEDTLKVVGKQLGFTDAERAGVLAHFIAGGQLTAGGIAQAITSFSQTVVDGDRADQLDDRALAAMKLAAA